MGRLGETGVGARTGGVSDGLVGVGPVVGGAVVGGAVVDGGGSVVPVSVPSDGVSVAPGSVVSVVSFVSFVSGTMLAVVSEGLSKVPPALLPEVPEFPLAPSDELCGQRK